MAKYVKKTNNEKMGRPKINIDEKSFENLCNMHCTLAEIAGFFDCSEDTIQNWCKDTYNMTFSTIYKIKGQKGNISLRRFQFRQAETNPTMAIWLGKQWLGQADKIEQTTSFEDLKPLADLLKINDEDKE